MLLRRLCLRQMSSSGINNSAHASNLGPLQQIIEQKVCLRDILPGFVVEKEIYMQINKELEPKFLQVFNDSHLHTGHVAMRGVQSKETHFRSACKSFIISHSTCIYVKH